MQHRAGANEASHRLGARLRVILDENSAAAHQQRAAERGLRSKLSVERRRFAERRRFVAALAAR